MGKKKFAKNPDTVRHFKLVARSQSDANVDDPNAMPLVLEPYVKLGDVRRSGLSQAELLQIPESLQGLGAEVFGQGEGPDFDLKDVFEEGDDDEGDESELGEDERKRLRLVKLEKEDCYFPDDGYDYNQHLKRVSGVGRTGGVVGVVMAAPKPVDPKAFAVQKAETTEEKELLAALEDADEYEALDEDVTLDQLFPAGPANDLEVILFGAKAEGKDMPDLEAFKQAHREAIGLVQTVGGDAEGVGISEGDFAAFLDEEYGNDDIGACENHEIVGEVDLEEEENIADEYLQATKKDLEKLHSINEPIAGKYDNVPRVIDETKALIARYYEEVDSDQEETEEPEEDDDSRNWDCESILSTLSNVSNRPGKIGRMKIIGKPKAKAQSLEKVAEGDENVENAAAEESDSGGSVIELPDVITERKKGETPEERRLRKASVKEMRRVCRRMKKESKEVYKAESLKLPGKEGGADIKPKTRYQKL